MAPPSCIFCDISSGKVPQTKLEVETDEYVIFKDIKPASTYHYLAVPKQHYESLEVLNKSHDGLITRMEDGLKKFLVSKNINTSDALFGFHLPPFITVKHLHMHAIAPRSEIGIIYRMVFRPSTPWFKTVSESRDYLKRNEL
ncbi:histidine triad nucleotide-binding protein 3-like [Scaptodrosophila lebanonensis]|uniref:Adenosine 5'-monophosphoramidase HINT3 n=1 Tax=Drosophila lebanonensis TaxID=7225 RepID=A0A6J2UCX9_DROLE|nr:histidine triad nucleotide-binding protein 3-like [Scaptodrosophila lebanonensis]